MHTFTYKFEELPLLSKNDSNYGLLDGEAEIRFDRSGEWFIGGIWLNGLRKIPDTEVNLATLIFRRCIISTSMEIEDHASWLYTTIWGRLNESPYADHIAERVQVELAELGISIPTDRQEHTTYRGQP